MALIDKDQLKKFKEAIADIIVSSQGLCTYDACKDVAEREAPFLISMLLQEPNIQSSNIIETIRTEIERLKDEYTDIAIDSHYGTVNANHVVTDLEQVLSFLDTLPEQPMEGLEEEIVLYSEKHYDYNSEYDTLTPNDGFFFSPRHFDEIARHFYELGCNAKEEEK